MASPICPVDGTKINEPTVRVVAGLVLLLGMIGLYFQSSFIFLFLVFDFFVRGYSHKKWSILRWFAIYITHIFQLPEKLIDAGTKRFAAKIGFWFSVALFILSVIPLPFALAVVGSILLVCALLESVFAFCLGCQFYTFYLKIIGEI